MTEEIGQETSEFGQGLTYCLGLFLAHAERHNGIGGIIRPSDDAIRAAMVSGWFNGASDHLYDLVIPETLPKELRERLSAFQTECLDLGHGRGLFNPVTNWVEKIDWALQEAKDLLRAIDEANGIHTIKGGWE